MTNTTKFLTALSVGGVLISTAAGFMVVNAQTAVAANTTTSNTNQNPRGRGLVGDNDKMEAVKTALDNKDYNAWKTAMATAPNGSDKLAKIDTQAKFDQLIQAHEYMKNNEFDKAKAIFDTLGIEKIDKKFGDRGGKILDPAQEANRKAVDDALDAGDYNAWKTAIATAPNGAEIVAKVDTQEKFTKLFESHKALKLAHEANLKVRTELGIDGLMGKGKGMGMRKSAN